MSSYIFQICSLFYIIMIMILFYTKEKIVTNENKLFSKIIFCNFIGLILDILSIIAIANCDNYPIVGYIFPRLYLVYLVTWISLFTIYIIYISYDNIQNEKVIKGRRIAYIGCIIVSLLCMILPLSYNNAKGEIYSYGAAADLVYLFSGLCIIAWLVFLFSNFKQIQRKKMLPIFIYMVLGIVVIFLQLNNPSLLLMTSMESFVVFVMFHTIENPDVKMIEKLNEAKDAAEKANMAKTDFLSNMSHEIRTPLNAIVGFSEAILEEDLPEKTKDEVQDIISASHSLLQLVNGILDISKIEANRLEIVNIDYNFEKVFDELVSLSKGRLGDKPLEFNYSYDNSIPPVLYGDHVRIKQVILNLLTNAIKYTKHGYVNFTVSSIIKDDICRLIISVEDSGIGIKEEDIDKLFTKFQRFDIENNITIEGTGLGLAITKKLIELMNGKIVVQSKYGEGSKFTIAIDQRIVPKTLDELTAEFSTDDSEKFIGNGSKVLVVDDNNINLKVANRLLSDYNLEIDLVSSGQECINKILDGVKYDLILLDDMMPKMSGTETLKNLKLIIGFNIPTVALTANAISGMREKYLESGFDDYLSKPIDKLKLEAVLKKYLPNDPDKCPKKEDTKKVVSTTTNTYVGGAGVYNNVISSISNDINEVAPKIESAEVNLPANDLDILVNNGVNIDGALELLGDMETYDDTVASFVDESMTRLENIKNYKEAGDMPNYAILVHAMKSDSKYLGFTKLAELSYNHEMASKGNDIEFVNQNYDELIAEANRVLEVIHKYIESKGE